MRFNNKHAVVLLSVLAMLIVYGCNQQQNQQGTGEILQLRFEFGTGPATLVGTDVIQSATAKGSSVVRVALTHGMVEKVFGGREYQMRIFLDSPEHDAVLYATGDRAVLVTPDFRMIQDNIPIQIDSERDEILYTVPMYHPNMSILAVLGWDRGAQYRHRTALDGLDYYGFEIGRAWFNDMQQKKEQSNEVFLSVSTEEEINAANNKGWRPRAGQTIPDDGTNPPGNPGPLYKGWPLTFPGNTRYWEYAGSSGFIKRVHIDTNGDGRIDAGEPHGYVGRCPYVVGINTQVMSQDSTVWTSRWRDHGQRIVHRFKKFKQADGSEKWQVESTHQTEQADGSWKNTEVTAPKTNPIVSEPYQDPNAVPGNSAFGL